MNKYHTNLQVTEFQSRQRGGRNGNRWWTSLVGFMKINFDGVVFADTNISGVRVVIRDDNGSVLASYSKKISQAYKSDEIETMAVTTTFSFAHKLGFRHAILEGDSFVLINALKTKEHSLAPMGLLIEDVKALFGFFFHHSSLLTQFPSLITYHLKYPTPFGTRFQFLITQFFLLFVGPIPKQHVKHSC